MRLGVVSAVAIGWVLLAVASPAAAVKVTSQAVTAPVLTMMGQASDTALDRLSQPGAFQADDAIRIVLPGSLQKAGDVLKLADKAGLTGDLMKTLNDAAGQAAQQAKPVFRSAIQKLTISDAMRAARQRDGVTQYLKTRAGGSLRTLVRPMVGNALNKSGAFAQLDRLGPFGALAGVGLSRDALTDSVTDQAMTGIFTYIGQEEARLRASPAEIGRALLKNFGM